MKKNLTKSRSKGKRYVKKKRTQRKVPAGRAVNAMIPVVNKIEHKYIDIDSSSLYANLTGSFLLLNPLVQGTSVSARVGDLIRMRTLDLNLRVWAVAKSRLVRYMIVLDTQAKGAAPTLSNLLEDIAFYTGPAPLSHRNKKSIDRFVVLRNKMFALNDIVTTAGQANENLFHEHVKLNVGVNYGLGNAGTIADISVNSIYFVILSTDASTGVVYDLNSRIRFTDD